MDILMLLTGFQLLSLSEAFNLSCPSQAHWKLRAKSTCKPAKNYTCLYDVTFQVNVYREKCNRPRILAEGYRYVFQPNLNRATCRLNRYQPFIFDTIGNSDCIFLKSFCKSEGQTEYENGNTTSDRTCFCNTKKGYTFVKNEGNQSYCNPSYEDCSCYVDIHPNNGTVELTDFNCYGEMNSNGSCSQGNALNKSKAFQNHEFDNFNYNLALPTNEYRTKTIMCVLISLFSYLLVVGVYILQRMKIQKTNSNQETKSQHTEPKTEKIIPIALPDVITRLKDEDKDTYIKLMQSEKQERRYFVRIMIVGREKTGKTCLMRRLIKESIDDVTSTDGLDIVVRKCKININDGSWTIKANISDDMTDRLQRAIIQNNKMENESSISYENMKNTYVSTQSSENIRKQHTTSKLVDSIPMIENTSEDETEDRNVNRDANIYTSNNIENFNGVNVNDNENSNVADKIRILKVNEDKNISAPLVMPMDLMSSVLSTTSYSDIPTNHHALCGLWDFAGQKEFYATHQAFLTSNAIYLVVANIADDISKKAVKQYFADFDNVGDYVDFWFDTIHCHRTVNPGVYESCNNYIDPPVIIVFTGKDEYVKLNNGKKTVAERMTELQNQLDDVLKKQTKYHHFRDMFCLSNTDDPDEEFEKLRLKISATARKMKHWGEKMPLKWILLEHLIEINKNEGKNFINFSDMIRMANHSDIRMVNKEDVKAFLHFQTKEGNIIFFDDLQDFIILNPQWLVEAFRCLVSDRMDPKLQHRSDWGDFKDNGRISESLIREFFESKGGKRFLDQTKDILKVMEKFDILIKIDETSSYIMPSMMPSAVFHEVCKQIGVEGADCKRTSWLCLKFEFLPPAFFTHFYLWFIRKYKPIYKDNEKPLWKSLFRGFCVFDLDKSNCKKLLVTMSTDTISLQLLSFSAAEEDLGSICSDIRAGIIDHTNAITKRYDLEISYELHFKCSKSQFDEDSIAYQELKNLQEYRCKKHTHLTKELYLPWMAYEEETARDILFNNQLISQPAKIKDTKLAIVEESERITKMIKVSNLPTGSTEDSIRFFFENKRKSGGGDIDDLVYEEDSYSAIITFEEAHVAESVISRMRRMPLLFEKKKIYVEKLFPPTLEEERNGQEFVIEVWGMKPTTQEDTLRYYFESRRAADADIVKMELIEEKNMYRIWFEEENAVEAIMSKSHRVDGQTLNIKRYVPPNLPTPVPNYKVFITNISPSTTRDELEDFLEAKSKGIPEEIIFGEAEGTALVTFEQPIDMEKLQTACMKRKLTGSNLSIHPVPLTDCIVVTGYKDNTPSDTVEYYFDNKIRSGVEGVKEVKLVEDERKFLVYFTEPASVPKVCRREHEIEGHVLKVQAYYKCLCHAAIDDDEPTFEYLKSIVIPNINPKKIEFLLNSDTNKMAFEKQLLRHYAVVEWPDSKKIKDRLDVNCTLTEEVKDYRKLAKTWSKTVTSEAEKFFNMLTVKETETLPEAWRYVLAHLREINISNPESVVIRVNKEECKIVIVGHKIPVNEVAEKVNEVAEKVESIMKDVAAEHDRIKQQSIVKVTLKHFQLRVLQYIHFMDKMEKEFEELCVQVNMKKNLMIFTGMSSHVHAAEIKMFEQIQEITFVTAGKFSVGYIEFLKIPEVKSYVGQQIKQKGVLGVWNVEEGNVITVYSLSDEDAVSACDVLKQSITEAPISLDDKQSALIGYEVWYEEIKTVEMEYQKALVKIVVADSKTIVIYQTSAEDAAIVKEKVMDIFHRHRYASSRYSGRRN